MNASEAQQYEALKRVIRRNLEPESAFMLACQQCGQMFPEQAEMGMVEAHFKIEHETDNYRLDLIWVGDGPAPESEAAE